MAAGAFAVIERGDAALNKLSALSESQPLVALVGFPAQNLQPLELLAFGTPKQQILLDVAQTPRLAEWIASTPLLAAHNAKTLSHRLLRRRLPLPARWACHSLCDLLLAEGRPTDAKETPAFLASSIASLQEEAGRLAARISSQGERLISLGMRETSRIESRCVSVLCRMEAAGMPFDADAWAARVAQEEQAYDRISAALSHQLRVDDIRPLAPQALLSALARAGHSSQGLDAANLAKLPAPLAEHLGAFVNLQRRLSAFGRPFLRHVGDNGRIHPTFEQIGTRTGRMACTRPNLQAVPSDRLLRASFVPPQGRVLVVGDYKACELRILADMSGDPQLAAAVEPGRDVHTEVAERLFGAQTTQRSDARQTAKMLGFGLIYGMGARGLARTLGVSVARAEELTAVFFKAFPHVRAFLHEEAQRSLEQGFCRTLSGRRLALDGPQGHDEERALRLARNSPIQGTSADIIKVALADVEAALTARPTATLVHCVHDELVVECDAGDADWVGEQLKDRMEAAGQLMLQRVRMEAGIEVAAFWGA